MFHRLCRSGPGLAAFLFGAGLAHFLWPRPYRAIVPAAVGDAALWVRWTGVAEIVCASLLVPRRTRRVGALAAGVVFVVVFPANVKMALDGGIPDEGRLLGSPIVAWLRLPLQVPLLLWARRVAKEHRPVGR